jgi:drug/metabolite transporter (DMT)-like permease
MGGRVTDGLTPQNDRRILALFLRLGAISCFSLMSVFIKMASDRGASLPEIIFWRQAMALPVILLILSLGSGFTILKTQRFGAHAMRSFIGLTCMGLTFGAVTRLQLAEATTISFLTPIFATLLSVAIFREKIGTRRIAAIVAGFVGVLIVVQPGGTTLEPIGLACGLIGALLVAVVSFQIRDLAKTEAPLAIVFWFTALSTLLLSPIWPLAGGEHDATSWAILFSIGTIGGIAQVMMTYSLRFAPVSTVVGMDYIALLWAVGADWLFWNTLPVSTTWLGASIIIASSIYIILRERKLALQRNREMTL